MTKLNEALREKFLTPQAAMRALGLDESLLREDDKETMNKKEKAGRAAMASMIAQDASLAEMTEFLKTLNASGSEGASEEPDGFDDDDEDGEDEIPGAITEPNAGVPPMAKEDGEGEHTEVATDEPAAAIHAILKDKCTPEELAKIGELLEKIATPEGDADNGHEGDIEGAVAEHTGIEKPEGEEKTEGEDEDTEDMTEKQDLVTRPAMDEAIRTAVANAEKRAANKAKALRDVEPHVGKLALDAALDDVGVYRLALTMLGVKGADKVHASALPVILEQIPLPGSKPAPKRDASLGMDSAAAADFKTMFPCTGRIEVAY